MSEISDGGLEPGPFLPLGQRDVVDDSRDLDPLICGLLLMIVTSAGIVPFIHTLS
jgi:hypothetical protein